MDLIDYFNIVIVTNLNIFLVEEKLFNLVIRTLYEQFKCQDKYIYLLLRVYKLTDINNVKELKKGKVSCQYTCGHKDKKYITI